MPISVDNKTPNNLRFRSLLSTLESGINIQVRLLIFEVFSRGYVLITGGYVY
jgi:hypothetical protein